MSSLNILYGDQAGTHFDLTHRTLSVGREASRDIQITDPKVSRKHAVIMHEDGSFVIQAVEAKNPIKVNGHAIEGKAVLKEGDLLMLGDTPLLFTDLEDDDRVDAVNESKIMLADDRTIM